VAEPVQERCDHGRECPNEQCPWCSGIANDGAREPDWAMLEPLAIQAERCRRAFERIFDEDPERWWTFRDLMDAADVQGATAAGTLWTLCNPERGGPLEIGRDLRIRRARA
jgi:hypothetical protein